MASSSATTRSLISLLPPEKMRPTLPTRGPAPPAAFSVKLPTLPRIVFGSSSAAATAARRAEAKQDLLSTIAPLARGAAADDAARAEVAAKFAALERLNPNPKSLAAPEINGRWKLLYTTSESILGTSRPPLLRPGGPIYQTIDARTLRARNQETWPFFNRVDAELTPKSASLVAVQFIKFYIFGLIPVTAPPTARGSLDVTYVDEDLRLSRGDKGNLFILAMDDKTKTL